MRLCLALALALSTAACGVETGPDAVSAGTGAETGNGALCVGMGPQTPRDIGRVGVRQPLGGHHGGDETLEFAGRKAFAHFLLRLPSRIKRAFASRDATHRGRCQ